MEFETTRLDGVILVTPKVFGDERGFFLETYNIKDFVAGGIAEAFVQDNHSRSSRGVLRGLHYQYPNWQGKLVRAIRGEIFDVAVDIRSGSPTFGEWVGVTLNEDNKQQLYVPPGFAHGFMVMSEIAEVSYKCTTTYRPQEEVSILWNDPDIGIEWPLGNPSLSEKDRNGIRLKQALAG